MIKAKLHKARIFFTIISAFMILTALIGCSMSNYGKLKSDSEITQAFENFLVLPNHKYYYRGAYSSPLVIVGIKENYTLVSKLWVEIDPQSKDFSALIDKVSLQGMSTGGTTHPWGFTILDQAGNEIGVWYSVIRAANVQVNEKNEIVTLGPIGVFTKGGQR